MSETFEMVAKTLYGLEEILAGELLSLGANDIQIGRRMVSEEKQNKEEKEAAVS